MKILERKVCTEDLNNMSIGDEITFKVPTARDIETARSLAYRMSKIEPKKNIKFSTQVDFESLLITIFANAKK